MIKAGFGKRDITPPEGTLMAGHPSEKYSTGVNDALYARCLIIEVKKEPLCFVSCDLLLVSDEIARDLKKRLAKTLSLPTEKIFITATHTHSGPLLSGILGISGDENPVKIFEQGVIAAAEAAKKKMVPVRLGFAATKIPRLAFNRRYLMRYGGVETHPMKGDPQILGPEGPSDPAATILYLLDEREVFLGGLVNFSCHATCLERENRLFSADYPGFIEEAIRRQKNSEAVVLFLPGASGNICQVNPLDLRQKEVGIGWARYMGYTIASALDKKMKRSGTLKDPKVRVKKIEVKLPLRRFTSHPSRRVRCSPPLSAPVLSNYGIEGYGWSGGLSLAQMMETKFWKDMEAKERLLLAEEIGERKYQKINVSAVEIDGGILVFLPCELFVEFGLKIKREAGREFVFISTLTNGYAGYLPTPKAFKRKGGYETVHLRSSRFAPQAGEILVQAVLDLIRS